MPKTKRVALLLSTMLSTQITRGVFDYLHQHNHWRLTINPEPTSDMSILSLSGWSGDGLIGRLVTNADLKAAEQLKLPMVNISAQLSETGRPRATVDQQAVGRLAAEHLLKCGFRRFAYCGQRGAWFSQERFRGFMERTAGLDCACSRLEIPSIRRQQSWLPWMERLEAWLKSLQTPVGLMAVHDPMASIVIDRCLRLGLRVPRDVAVVGVENLETVCNYAEVPISSVPCNGRAVGYEAAALLDRMMSDKRSRHVDVMVPPEEVVGRESTDVVAVEDPHVAAAVHYIRDNVDGIFGVEILDKVSGISRRALEQRFRKFLDCTPHQYICRARVEHVKELLNQHEKMKLQQIARRCGFTDIRCMRRTFERIAGMTLAEYRLRQKKQSDSITPFM